MSGIERDWESALLWRSASWMLLEFVGIALGRAVRKSKNAFRPAAEAEVQKAVQVINERNERGKR